MNAESEIGQTLCEAPNGLPDPLRAVLFIFGQDNGANMSGLYPEWTPVIGRDPNEKDPVVLEGKVETGDDSQLFEHPFDTGNSVDDWPASHYTHDFIFDVIPDEGFKHLLGIQHFAKDPNNPFSQDVIDKQKHMEIEWETGIAASNDGNDFAGPNRVGDSGGFFSEGHKRYDVIWNWPIPGDHVHVEGNWIWDRGHPPALTEIHPPRLVSTQRQLPVNIGSSSDVPANFERTDGSSIDPLPEPIHLATRNDVYASPDDGAFVNNRPDKLIRLESGGGGPTFFQHTGDYVQRVHMSEKDYVFNIDQLLPPPSDSSTLKWKILKHPGNSFNVDPIIDKFDKGTVDDPKPHVTVTIPWKSQNVDDNKVFAQTIYVYWDDPQNAGRWGTSQQHADSLSFYRLHFKNLAIIKETDVHAGEFRVLLAVDGKWLFLNEFAATVPYPGGNPPTPYDHIIENSGGLDGADDAHAEQDLSKLETDPNTNTEIGSSYLWPNYRTGQPIFGHVLANVPDFYVIFPKDKQFLIHAGGWEADGINDGYGKLVDPHTSCHILKQVIGPMFLNLGTGIDGCKDDPIGQINEHFGIEGTITSQFLDLNGLQPNGEFPLSFLSRGPFTPDVGICGGTDPDHSYAMRFSFQKINLDTTPPVVTGTPDRQPDSPDNGGWYTKPVKITWTGQDEPGGSGLKSCDSPTTYSGPDGKQVTVQGHCIDNAGNLGTGSFTFNYDATPPDTSLLSFTDGDGLAISLDGGSSTVSNQGTLKFSGSDSIGISGFECKLDKSQFAPCSSPFELSNTKSGDHEIQVRAKDLAGNKDLTPAIVKWKVLTPGEAAQNLYADIRLSRFDINAMRSLSITLHPAVRILNDGIDSNDGSACGQIGLFIQGVNGFKVMDKLSDSQAQNLINQANRIDHRIGCNI